MKIIVIGDIHGHDTWQEIVNKEEDADKIIFVGDYFDRFGEGTSQEQFDNYLNIVRLKQEKDVHILIGNHDLHYICVHNRCSGFNGQTFTLVNETLNKHIRENILEVAYRHNNILFSHAGFTKDWCFNNEIDVSTDIDNNKLQKEFIDDPIMLGFEWRGFKTSGYGDNIWQSPCWVRPHSLRINKVNNFIQVVGHTPTELKEDCGIWFVDSLFNNQYLEIRNEGEVNEFIIKNI